MEATPRPAIVKLATSVTTATSGFGVSPPSTFCLIAIGIGFGIGDILVSVANIIGTDIVSVAMTPAPKPSRNRPRSISRLRLTRQ